MVIPLGKRCNLNRNETGSISNMEDSIVMKKMVAILSVICLTAVLSAVSLAQTPGVTNRQVNQQKRIGQGVRSGELTRREVRRLEREQNQIRKMKVRARSDGEVTNRERARIHHEQNQSNRHIFRAKNNRRDRN